MNKLKKDFTFVFLCIIIFLCSCSSKEPESNYLQSKHIAFYCKVWGFMKYYHPAVAKGLIHWDSLFIVFYPQIRDCHTKEDFNKIILLMIKGADQLNEPEQISTPSTKINGSELMAISDFSWIKDRDVFTNDISQRLQKLKEDFLPMQSHYVSFLPAHNPMFITDTCFSDVKLPDENTRMLALARYWNIIQYFHPIKDSIQHIWDSVLMAFIPQIIKADDSLAFHLAFLRLTKNLKDGHAATVSKILYRHFGSGILPIGLSFVENKFVITQILNDMIPLSISSRLHRGDVVTEFNGEKIIKIHHDLDPYLYGSNYVSCELTFCYLLTFGTPANVATISVNNGRSQEKIQLSYLSRSDIPQKFPVLSEIEKVLEHNIGYINMGILTKEYVPSVMRDLRSTNAIIFDLRYYPHGTMYDILPYLTTLPRSFYFMTIPSTLNPGYVTKDSESHVFNPLTYDKEIFHYKGKIILLVNEYTLSQAEFTAMALQSIQNVKTFGSQTAGADGNVSEIILPGKIGTSFTGLGIYYPDGTPTQHVGLKIDYIVKPTIKGIREGKDEVLDRAIHYLIDGI